MRVPFLKEGGVDEGGCTGSDFEVEGISLQRSTAR
jgi:hypothetical protein